MGRREDLLRPRILEISSTLDELKMIKSQCIIIIKKGRNINMNEIKGREQDATLCLR